MNSVARKWEWGRGAAVEKQEVREQMRHLQPDNQAPDKAGGVFQLSPTSFNLSAEIAITLLLPQSPTSLHHFIYPWEHDVRTIW